MAAPDPHSVARISLALAEVLMPSLQDLFFVLNRRLVQPAQRSWIVAVVLFEPDRGEPDLGVRIPGLDVDMRRF